MINIYSIEDIIQASENILKSLPKKKDLIQNDDIINEKKMTIDQPLVLKNEITVQSDVPKDIEKIILQAETSQMINLDNQKTKEKKFKNKIIKSDNIVDKLYTLFNKKIKKNTLKLVVELKNEILFLDEKIISLKQKEKKINEINKLIKKDILDLANVERNLNYNLKEKDLTINSINDQLGLYKDKIIKLEDNNKNLMLKINNYQNQYRDLEISNSNVKSESKELSVKIKNYENRIYELENDNKELNLKLNEQSNQLSLLNNNNKELNLKISELDKLNEFKLEAQELRQKNSDLEVALDQLKINDNKNDLNLDIIKSLKEKMNFYQEENVRISNELMDSRKKYEVTKNQIEGFEVQRSNLLNKMSSINEALNNSKIVSNIFEKNQSENELEYDDKENFKKKNYSNSNIDKEISSIFKAK